MILQCFITGIALSASEMFSAASSMVGYIYQCEYALYRALDVDDPAEHILVETLDDVVVEGVTNAVELLQLKHHDPATTKAFTDKSADLWKTIRIWSSLIAEGRINAAETKFFLLTTASASPSSKLAQYLSPRETEGNARAPRKAEPVLMEIAEQMATGTSDDQKKNAEPFLSLSKADRALLINNMTIVPKVEVVENLRPKIVQRLRHTGAVDKNLEELTWSLVGWWYGAVIQILRSKQRKTISKDILHQRIADLVTRYVVASLPTFDDIKTPDADEQADLKRRLFVQQLVAIGHAVDKIAVTNAMVDFYQASGHISRWMEDLRLDPQELTSFQDALQGHWAVCFGAIEPEADLCGDGEAGASELSKLGRKALQNSLLGSQATLKGRSDDYLRRGVLHKMANEPVLGWHPHWATKFGSSK